MKFELPVAISNLETMVRCVCSPYHYDGKKLTWKAFYPPKDSDGVSVIRSDFAGADECKRRGKMLSDPARNKIYRGLAAIQAFSVRECGAGLVDSRDVFHGHADILHGHVMPDGEPPNPHVLEQVRERCKRMLGRSKFHLDPQPEIDEWTGEVLSS